MTRDDVYEQVSKVCFAFTKKPYWEIVRPYPSPYSDRELIYMNTEELPCADVLDDLVHTTVYDKYGHKILRELRHGALMDNDEYLGEESPQEYCYVRLSHVIRQSCITGDYTIRFRIAYGWRDLYDELTTVYAPADTTVPQLEQKIRAAFIDMPFMLLWEESHDSE